MSKKEYCCTHPVIAVYSLGLIGLEIHGIEDRVYFTDWIGAPHQARVYFNTGCPYFNFLGRRIRLDECIRV